jgi:hypothetical protein
MVRTKVTPLRKDLKPRFTRFKALQLTKSNRVQTPVDEIEDFSDDDKTVIVEPTDPVIMSNLERKKVHDTLYKSPERVTKPIVCPGAPLRPKTQIRWWCGHCKKANGQDHRWCMEAYDFNVEKWEAARVWNNPLEQLNDELHK